MRQGEPKFTDGTYNKPRIETQGLFGGVAIYDKDYQFQWATPVEAHLNKRVTAIERRVARLETMQRRKPKRKAHR